VLTNLLDNAYKFTPQNGVVEVTGRPYFWERRNPRVDVRTPHHNRRVAVAETPNCYRIDIRDSGPGVPEEELDRIFEPYSSYAGSKDRAGAGLGLAICRMILEAHDGTIFAVSRENGAQISILLPADVPSSKADSGAVERLADTQFQSNIPRLMQ